MYSSRKYPATEGNGNSEEGGFQKEAISEGMGGCLKRFFPAGLSKVGELLMKNSFSVEKAIIYFTVTVVSKHVLLLNAFFTAYAIVFFDALVIGWE